MSRGLPRGVLTSTMVGVTAAGCGWLLSGLATTFSSSYTRLDQVTALMLGGAIGAGVIAAREHRRRGQVGYGILAGAILGGAGALAGASVLAFTHALVAPRAFVIERTAAWMLAAVGATLLLTIVRLEHRGRWIGESLVLSALGGAGAGLIFMLPGASDVWQAVACLWFGGWVGLAVCGPELWHARGVIELLPAKGTQWRPLLAREWPLHDGVALALGEAHVACEHGRIAFYPPAGGAVAEGRNVREPRFMTATTTIAVGRARYHLRVFGAP